MFLLNFSIVMDRREMMMIQAKGRRSGPKLIIIIIVWRCDQMENITMFLTFCENYGVPKSGQFQTVDLYEGTNMPQFLSCIQQLGSEVDLWPALWTPLTLTLMTTLTLYTCMSQFLACIQ